jgi:hypothetical protein
MLRYQWEMSSIGRYKLLKPVIFEVHYDMDDSLWCLENYDLALRGYGKTYNMLSNVLREI